MICSNCGSSVDGSKKFCQVCGYSVKPVADDGLDTGVFSGTPASSNSTALVNAYQGDDYSINKPSYPQPATPAEHNDDIGFEEKPKKRLPKKLLVPVAALFLAVTMAFGAWGVYLEANPTIKLANALKKTLFDSKSFAFEISYDGDELADGYVAFGKTTFTSDFVVDIFGKTLTCDDGQLLVPYGKREYVAVDMPEAFEEIAEELDDVIREITGDDSDEAVSYLKENYGVEVTPEQVAVWAESFIEDKTVNESVIEEIWNTVAVSVIASKLDIRGDDVPDYSALKGILAETVKKGISEEAFRIEEKYKEDSVKYFVCKVNVPELEKSVIEYTLGNKKLEAILDASYEGSENTVRENLELQLKELENSEDKEVEMVLGIKDGFLTYVKYGDMLEIKLTDINKNHTADEDYEQVRNEAYLIEELEFDEIIDELSWIKYFIF